MDDKNNGGHKVPLNPLNIARIISAFVIICIFAFMFVFTLFFSRTERSMYDEKLTKMPEFDADSFFHGKYTDQLDKYLTDTIHNRDDFKSTAAKIRYHFGIEQDEYTFGSDAPFFSESSMTFPDDSSEEAEESAEPVSEESYEESHCSEADESSSGEPSEEQSLPEESSMTEESSAPDESSMTEESSVPEESSEQEVDESVFGLITVIGKGKNVRALEVFPGLEYLENACVSYARRIDAFTEKSGVNVYSMVIPKSCAFYLGGSKKYGHLQKNSLEVDNRIKELLTKATYVDAYHALEAHKDEEIYARTDFHWTGLGAYYAGAEFAKAAGINYPSKDAYTLSRRSGYYGNMYNSTNHFAPLKDNPEDLITMVPKAPYKAYYYDTKYRYKESYTNNVKNSVFVPVSDRYVTGWYETHIGGDMNIVRIETDVRTGRKLFIIKDSYGDALAPLFMSSYDEIYIADLRYMEINALDFIREHGITDVLFGLSSNTACTSLNKNIERIMK